MSTPQVTVVIPAYNAAWCLERAVESVLAQDFDDFELLVINDGSTDDTAAVVDRFDDPRVQRIDQANQGLSAARNRGIRAARGEYVAFLDADDWWLPGKLQAQVQAMQADPELGFCSTATEVHSPEGQHLHTWRCPTIQGDLLQTIFRELAAVAGSGSAVMARKACFERAGLFDENLKSLEDIDMWMRLAAISGYTCIDEPLAAILKHPQSMSRNLKVMRRAAIQVVKKNRKLLPPSLQGSFWRNTLAGVHADYAKGAYRAGRKGAALADVAMAFALAPWQRGRLCLGLLKEMALGRPL